MTWLRGEQTPLQDPPKQRYSLEGPSICPDLLCPDRVEAMTLSDCQQELRLVQMVTQGPRAFLSQEEAQRFLKE